MRLKVPESKLEQITFKIVNGISVNLVKYSALDPDLSYDPKIRIILRGTNKKSIPTYGTVNLTIKGKSTRFHIVRDDSPIKADGILGQDYLKGTQDVISCYNNAQNGNSYKNKYQMVKRIDHENTESKNLNEDHNQDRSLNNNDKGNTEDRPCGLPIFDGYNLPLNTFILEVEKEARYVLPSEEEEFIYYILDHLRGDASTVAQSRLYQNYDEVIHLLNSHFSTQNLMTNLDCNMPFYDGYNTSLSDFEHAVYKIAEKVPADYYDKFMDILRNHIQGVAKEIIDSHMHHDHVELLSLLGEYFKSTENQTIIGKNSTVTSNYNEEKLVHSKISMARVITQIPVDELHYTRLSNCTSRNRKLCNDQNEINGPHTTQLPVRKPNIRGRVKCLDPVNLAEESEIEQQTCVDFNIKSIAPSYAQVLYEDKFEFAVIDDVGRELKNSTNKVLIIKPIKAAHGVSEKLYKTKDPEQINKKYVSLRKFKKFDEIIKINNHMTRPELGNGTVLYRKKIPQKEKESYQETTTDHQNETKICIKKLNKFHTKIGHLRKILRCPRSFKNFKYRKKKRSHNWTIRYVGEILEIMRLHNM